jgi:site-specific DNA-methyltransferase (adenine-specific)
MKEKGTESLLFTKPFTSYPGLTLSEINQYLPALRRADDINFERGKLEDGLFLADAIDGLSRLPKKSIDLIITEPPSDPIHEGIETGSSMTLNEFYHWNENWLAESHRILKATGAIYVLCDWKKSGMYHSLLSQFFHVQSRITWKNNGDFDRTNAKGWKNVLSDIWYATKSEEFMFDGILVSRKNIKEYTLNDSINFWDEKFKDSTTDMIDGGIPEEIILRLLNASSFKLSWVVDPFTRYGLTGVASKKMGRRFIGLEMNQDRLLMAMKRIDQT